MKRKTKDIIILTIFAVYIIASLAISIFNEVTHFIKNTDIFILIFVIIGFAGLFICIRPLSRIFADDAYAPKPVTEEEWIQYYKDHGFILSELHFTPEGFCNLIDGKDIRISLNNINYYFVISLKEKQDSQVDC